SKIPYMWIDWTGNEYIYSVEMAGENLKVQAAETQYTPRFPRETPNGTIGLTPCISRDALPPGTYKGRKEKNYKFRDLGIRASWSVELLAQALNLDQVHINELKFASFVHDLRALGMDEMLWAPRKFSQEQLETFK